MPSSPRAALCNDCRPRRPMDVATLEMHLGNLRKKIGAARVRTVRGIGYQLVT